MSPPFGLPWAAVGAILVPMGAAISFAVIRAISRLPDEWLGIAFTAFVLAVVSGLGGAGFGGVVGFAGVWIFELPTGGETLAEEMAKSGTHLLLGAMASGTVLGWVAVAMVAWRERQEDQKEANEVAA